MPDPIMYLSGPQLRHLMRGSQVTIRALAARLQIPMVRIRQRRLTGLTCPYATRDWLQAITGRDPGVILAPVTSRQEVHRHA